MKRRARGTFSSIAMAHWPYRKLKIPVYCILFFFSSRRRHTRFDCDWSSDVCSSDLGACFAKRAEVFPRIKTEAADFTHRTSSSILVFGTVRLGGVFDHNQAMLASKL